MTGRVENSPRIKKSHPYKLLEGRSCPTEATCLLRDKKVFTLGERSRESSHGRVISGMKAQLATPANGLSPEPMSAGCLWAPDPGVSSLAIAILFGSLT